MVVISIVACCSGSLASIAVYLNNLTTGIYCATILVVIVFLALCYSFILDMDPNDHPNDDVVPPPAGGSQGSLASPHGGDPAGRSSQCQASDASSIVLRISPASGSARFGYIYVATNERHLQDALMVYFDTSGRDILVFPCLDFDSFMQDHSLTNSNISFVSNLLSYIIPAGNKILEAERYAESPNQDWVPAPPDFSSDATSSSPSLLSGGSGHHSSYCGPNDSRRHPNHGRCPDPNGYEPSYPQMSQSYYPPLHCVPSYIMGGSMGGSWGSRGISPLTHNSYGGPYGTYGGGHDSIPMGGRPPVAPLPPQFEVLPMAASSQATTLVPLAEPDLSLGSRSLVTSVLKDSSATPTKVKGTTALVIKDKPSDLGLKDITDKDFLDRGKEDHQRLSLPLAILSKRDL